MVGGAAAVCITGAIDAFARPQSMVHVCWGLLALQWHVFMAAECPVLLIKFWDAWSATNCSKVIE